MKKVSKVVFISDKLQDAYSSLKDSDPLKKSLKRAILNLQENAFSGIAIPKYLIPKEYAKIPVVNLWKYDLPRGWRLLYTITTDNEVEVITIILEWFDHKDYERRMKY